MYLESDNNRLVDKSNHILGELINLKLEDGFYQADLVNDAIHYKLRELFSLFEKYVLDQSLMLLDDLDSQIDEYGLRLLPSDRLLYNIQLTSDNHISFKLK